MAFTFKELGFDLSEVAQIIDFPVCAFDNKIDYDYKIKDGYTYLRTHLINLEVSDSILHDGEWPIKPEEYLDTLTIGDAEKLNYAAKKPKIASAIELSLDGVHIVKVRDFANFSFGIHGFVWMRAEDITFWKLKFGSDN